MNYAGKFDVKIAADGSGLHSQGHAHVETFARHATHAPSDAIIVPDAQLLFNGEFTRSGVDLILSRDGHELVLQDYFKGEKRATLASPDGAHLTGDLVSALTGYTEYAQADGSASVGHVIGHVTKLTGTATAVRNGVSIILHQGDNVEKGDVVESGSNSVLGITFIDGTVFGLSSNARMVLNEMVYEPNGSSNSTLLSLVAGTITFVAGETAKHGDMKIDTPVATMGIRGTAVLVEIDFSIPGQGGAPDAKFQVLVEPDGTTGKYILFDKNTLTPIATVDQAGQQINISQGQISITNAPLPPDVQDLISKVFALKFSDANPKTFDHFTDFGVPQALQPIQLANGPTATPIVQLVKTPDNPAPSGPGGPTNSQSRVDGPPAAVIVDSSGHPSTGFSTAELAGKTGDATHFDTVSFGVNFTDFNAGDAPTVSAKFDSFKYQNATHNDVTATLNQQQLADIAAVEAKLLVVPNPNNNNNGSANLTYSVPDNAFDFLAAGEQIILTYLVKVDNNFAANDEATTLTLTITVTGTNDVPVITTGAQAIAFSGGTSVPGGDLTTGDPTSGTLSFTDVDLTDTHTVSTKLASTSLSGSDALPPGPLSIFETALSASIATDSKGTGTGTISWKLADLPVYIADFIPKGQTLTLTYTVTVTDSQNATSTQDVVVTITGTDTPAVVWIATTVPGSTPGGLWSDAANWETGTVPTATDDAIIITDQLHGLTPSFPVTIDAPAFAKSLTVNDFGTTPPELDNNSTLTIGGLLGLDVDAILKNFGTISVGGLAEILNRSVLQNSGFMTLGQGGDFKDQSSITNSGRVEVSGGTLNIEVDVGNAGGDVTVDGGAKVTLNGAAIDGGTLSISISGTLDSIGISAITDVGITNSGLIEATGGLLTIDPAVLVTITNFGTLEANGGELDITHEPVTNTGTLQAIDDSTLKLTSTVVTNSGGTVSVESGSTLDLVDASISGGTLSISGTLDSIGISAITDVDITNSGVIEATGGLLTIDPAVLVTITNFGTLEANGGELDITGEPVTNTGALRAIDDSALKLTSTVVTNSGGTMSVESGSTLDLVDASIRGGTLSISGTLDSIGISAIDGATINNAGILEASGGTLTIDAASTVNNTGTFEVNGGNLIVETALSGTAKIMGASLLELGASSTTAYSSANIIFADAATGTLKLDHAETFGGTVSGLDNNTLDLGDITSGTNTTITYLGDSTHGTLTIVSNADPTQVAQIKLTGDYLGASWIAASDGPSGGTTVSEVPGAITAGLDAHGNAVEGNIVTASITDGGSSVTNATYEWQSFDTAQNNWVDGSGTGVTSASYIPGELDEGHALRVSISFTDVLGNTDHQTVSAGTVTGTADTPMVSTPNPVTTTDGVPTHLTGLSVSTTDGGADDTDTFTAKLYVEHGTLALDGELAATINGGDGHDLVDAVVITGSLADVNAALAAVNYTPAGEYEGTDTVHFGALSTEEAAVGGNVSAAATETTAIITVTGTASANLVVNGSFETGNFSGWIQSGNTGATIVSSSGSHDGVYNAWLGPVGSDGYLTQNIPTVAGQHYILDFWLSNDGGSPNDFSVSWNGATLFSPYVNVGSQSYSEYKFDLVGSGVTSALQFTFRQDPRYWHLDGVSVTVESPSTPAMSFTTIDDPGASATYAFGINNAGQIVGQATADPSHEIGWEYTAGAFALIGVAGAQDNSAHAINNLNVVAGDYSPVRSTPRYGFVETSGSYSRIVSDSPYPSTNANGINDVGVLVGSDYLHTGARYSGYIDDHGAITYLNVPAAANPSGDTFANGINNHGLVVGSYNPNAFISTGYQGFLYNGSTYTTIADPLGVNGTFAQGINDNGEIVGYFVDANHKQHGFIDNGGAFTTVDDPLGVNGSALNGINDAGVAVGYYIDANQVTHGFVANPAVTITVLTPSGLDFHNDNPLKEMGAGTIQPSHGSTTFTIVDAAANHEFVLDGNSFTYGSNGGVTGGTITSFHEFTADGVTALADFTGLSVDAVTWMSAVQQDAAGNKSAAEALTSSFAYIFNGGPGSDSFGSAGHADILSGTGNDFFDGGGAPVGSHDTLTGGAGSTFVFQKGYGALTITNFDQGAGGVFDQTANDHIQLNNLASLPTAVIYADGNTILDFGNNDAITLLNVTQSEFAALAGAEFSINYGNNNNGPVINGAGNTITYTGTPVVIDPSVAVLDTTGTVDSVNVWISSGFHSGDTLTIGGNLDGDLVNSDGSTIHYNYDSSAHGIYLAATAGTATAGDFDAALHLIQFSPGAADGSRTVTWAAHDNNNAFSPTETTTVDVGPILNSFTLTVSQGGTTVLSNSDFNVSDPGFTDLTYTVNNVTGGQFEVYNGSNWVSALTGGFTTAQIAAGHVEFVQDRSATVPDFSMHVSDGSNASPDIAPMVSLEISGADSRTVTFAGSNGTLILDSPSTFTGEIAGISGRGDVLDLKGVDAADHTVVASTAGHYDSVTDTTSLVVTDTTTDNSVTLKLAGDYSVSTWTVTDDGHGGANIVDPPASTNQAIGPVIAHDPGPAASETIVASAPNQTLIGAGTSDTFVFNFAGVGHDTVTDFHPGADALQFLAPMFANAQAALNATHDDGQGNTVVALDAQDTITLTGVLKTQLHVSDFHVV